MKTTQELIKHANGRFYYLASPYSHPNPAERDIRAEQANRYAGVLMQAGLYVMPTIYLTHENVKRFQLPTDHVWWMGFNKAFIDVSAGMIIAQIPGWDASKGVTQEINYSRSRNLPVIMAHLNYDNELTLEGYPGK